MDNKKCTAGNLAAAGALIAVLTVIDQVTKLLAAAKLSDGPFVIWPGVFELRYLENRGAAFSILTGHQWFFIVLSILFLAAAFWIYRKVPRTKRMKPLRICIVFLSAGAFGNLIDRVFLGYVRDFFYFSLIDFPIFNVADICVSVTMCVLIILILFVYRDHDFDFLKRTKPETDEALKDGENGK
jgi:signal peptidase II